MIVKDWMSPEPRVVRATDRAEVAARALWERDCGMVPVVDAAGALVGIVTDRDLCMAALLQGRALTEIAVASAMSRRLTTIRPEAGLADAMAAMQQVQVHRLPVVDALGNLVGVLSTNDLLRAGAMRAADGEHVLRTLAAIGKPRTVAVAGEAAAVAVLAATAEPAAQPAAVQAAELAAGPAVLPTPTAKRAASGKAAAKPRQPTAAKPTAAKPAAKARVGAGKRGGKKS